MNCKRATQIKFERDELNLNFDHRGIHSAVLGSPFVELCTADAVLTENIVDGCAISAGAPRQPATDDGQRYARISHLHNAGAGPRKFRVQLGGQCEAVRCTEDVFGARTQAAHEISTRR